MGGGGGGDQQSTSYTTTIPEWAMGAHKKLIGEAEDVAYSPDFGFPQYQDERIAGFTPYQEAGMGAREQMYQRGDPLGEFGARNLMSPTYQQKDFAFGTFNPEVAQRYMDPYMQTVVNAEKQAAADEYRKQGMRSDAERVASGSRGGYREAMEQSVGRAQQGRVMADIQGRGQQRAWQDAQQQYERDRNAAIQAARMGDASALEAARMRMGVAQQADQMAGAGQQRALQRIKELEQAGVSQQQMDQAHMDLAYEDMIREYEFPKSQMNWLSGILSGVPGQMMQYTRKPGASPASQALAYGVGGAALQNLMRPAGAR
tara:strand:- start:69 stop:1016 length:948 start_codon:yes stop_codon:yes gene_type:complete